MNDKLDGLKDDDFDEDSLDDLTEVDDEEDDYELVVNTETNTKYKVYTKNVWIYWIDLDEEEKKIQFCSKKLLVFQVQTSSTEEKKSISSIGRVKTSLVAGCFWQPRWPMAFV